MKHNADIVGFAEGSHVLMADGKWKTIEQIKEGDMVMSFDPSLPNSDLEPRKVTDTWSGLLRECIEVHQNKKVTVVAKDQLFFTPEANWAQCYETKQVLDYYGNVMPIQTRNVRGGKWKIYDITVDETHSFIVNDMRVHNKKKKVPQPVVTAGKPGLPVSVTTTTTKRGVSTTTTVVVNPSPGSSAQVSVSSSGNINVRQNSIPGLPVSDNVDPGMYIVLPYPGGSYVYDRAVNAEIIRDSVCGSILSKGSNYRITRADASAWGDELQALMNELQSMKSSRVSTNGGRTTIKADPSGINEALSQARALKKELVAGRRVTLGHIQQNCDKLQSMIQRIQSSVGFIDGRGHEGRGHHPIPNDCSSGGTIIIQPGPSCYHSERVYEDNANYGYIERFDNTCQYIFDPPDAPAVTSVRYYKHWDPISNKYYYDRISAGATCSTFGGNTQA